MKAKTEKYKEIYYGFIWYCQHEREETSIHLFGFSSYNTYNTAQLRPQQHVNETFYGVVSDNF
jgi:hypothetical protein